MKSSTEAGRIYLVDTRLAGRKEQLFAGEEKINCFESCEEALGAIGSTQKGCAGIVTILPSGEMSGAQMLHQAQMHGIDNSINIIAPSTELMDKDCSELKVGAEKELIRDGLQDGWIDGLASALDLEMSPTGDMVMLALNTHYLPFIESAQTDARVRQRLKENPVTKPNINYTLLVGDLPLGIQKLILEFRGVTYGVLKATGTVHAGEPHFAIFSRAQAEIRDLIRVVDKKLEGSRN